MTTTNKENTMGNQSNETIRITVTPAEYETIRHALRTAAGHLANAAAEHTLGSPAYSLVAEMDDLYDRLPEPAEEMSGTSPRYWWSKLRWYLR